MHTSRAHSDGMPEDNETHSSTILSPRRSRLSRDYAEQRRTGRSPCVPDVPALPGPDRPHCWNSIRAYTGPSAVISIACLMGVMTKGSQGLTHSSGTLRAAETRGKQMTDVDLSPQTSWDKAQKAVRLARTHQDLGYVSHPLLPGHAPMQPAKRALNNSQC